MLCAYNLQRHLTNRRAAYHEKHKKCPVHNNAITIRGGGVNNAKEVDMQVTKSEDSATAVGKQNGPLLWLVP